MSNMWRKIIAFTEMAGGLLGVVTALFSMYILLETTEIKNKLQSYQTLAILLHALCVSLFLLSFIAGLFLWKKRKLGVGLSIIVQILQIPQISAAGFSYLFFSGLQLGLGIESMKVQKLLHIGSNFNISEDTSFFLGINIVPILFLWQLHKKQPVPNLKDRIARWENV